ncbi:hypothetical protein [Embleya sp. NPDC059237]|uniref:hypothetical protein n=1 Tax=Embleya sp. NPDC059237 TaxID=3346784 RepID=UPI0036BEBA4C
MTQSAASAAPHSAQRITALTRRDIFNYLSGEGGPWWGRLEEIDFLGSLRVRPVAVYGPPVRNGT